MERDSTYSETSERPEEEIGRSTLHHSPSGTAILPEVASAGTRKQPEKISGKKGQILASGRADEMKEIEGKAVTITIKEER